MNLQLGTFGQNSKMKKRMKHAYACDNSEHATATAARKAQTRSQRPEQPTFDPRMEEYQRHLKAVKNMKCTVDCSLPIVPKTLYQGTSEYNVRGKVFERIERDNARLLHKIATIYSGNGTIDNNLNSKPFMNRTGQERAKQIMNIVYQNYHIYQSLKKVKPHHSRIKDAQWYAEQEKHMDRMSLYPLHFKKCPCSQADAVIIEASIKKPKQCAYLQVEMQDTTVCNLIFELNAGVCPFTVENFKQLCRSATNCDNPNYTYRWKKLDKLITCPLDNGELARPFWQVGLNVDVLPKYEKYMAKEKSKFKHTQPGLLTRPKSIPTGMFYITLGPCPFLDDNCNIFGRLIGPGMKFLKKMQQIDVDREGHTKRTLVITDCGVVSHPSQVPAPMMMTDFVNMARSDMHTARAPASSGKFNAADDDDEEDEDDE